MQYKIILEDGAYALILRGKTMQQYAVVNGLDKATGEWAYTCKYYGFGPGYELSEPLALSRALDCFLQKTDSNYISRLRLEELVTKLKDGLIEDDEETALEYFKETCDMSTSEMQWLGITECILEETSLEQIETFLRNRIERCYQEELTNYGIDYKGQFIGCYKKDSFLVIEYAENSVKYQTLIRDYELLSLEQLYYFWQLESFVGNCRPVSKKE